MTNANYIKAENERLEAAYTTLTIAIKKATLLMNGTPGIEALRDQLLDALVEVNSPAASPMDRINYASRTHPQLLPGSWR